LWRYLWGVDYFEKLMYEDGLGYLLIHEVYRFWGD
jgi:hypothetical protein